MANILMIDDDKQLLKLMGMMLQRGGHTPTLISDPEEGLAHLMEDRPDLLIVDVMMPGLSGHSVCRQIRATKELEDLPIMILTARAQDVDREAALKSGADDYLSKPVAAQDLLQHIDDLLRQKGSASESEDGVVISLFSLRGGVGRTTLAVNLAATLRRQSQQEVCLFDLASAGGQAALHLRLQAKNSWQDLPADGDYNWDSLLGRLQLHPSGLRLLAAPVGPQSPELLTTPMVSTALKVLRKSTAFTILDLPPIYSQGVVAALQASDLVLHVIQPEVISIQLALQANRALARVQPAIKQIVYVLNQTMSEAQLPIKAVERGLNTRLPFLVGCDGNQARALAQGVPLSLTNVHSPLPASIERIATAIQERSRNEVAI